MSAPAPKEKTFTAYTLEQGLKYAQNRMGYHPSLYKMIIDYHTSSGGQLETLLDVGCGPGVATRELAPQFSHVIGLDPSKGMISAARTLGGENIKYEVSSAEELGKDLSPPLDDSSVDVITIATAAHWADMSKFWPSAAHVLKPGGTVAIWTTGGVEMHDSMPNAAAIQAYMLEHEEKYSKPYFEPGTLLARSLYRTLPLPWTLSEPVMEFDQSTFLRKEWDGSKDQEFFSGNMTVDLDTMENSLETMSNVTRWREAHPDAVGTERDVVRVMRREIERLLHEAGVEKGKEMVTGTLTAVLLLVKKKA